MRLAMNTTNPANLGAVSFTKTPLERMGDSTRALCVLSTARHGARGHPCRPPPPLPLLPQASPPATWPACPGSPRTSHPGPAVAASPRGSSPTTPSSCSPPPRAWCWLWHEGVLLQPPPRLAAAIEQLGRGVPWMSAGAPLGVKDPSSLSRALVVGLWNVDTPARIPHEAGVLSVITHKDPACAAAAAAYAQAVCLGLAPHRPPRWPPRGCPPRWPVAARTGHTWRGSPVQRARGEPHPHGDAPRASVVSLTERLLQRIHLTINEENLDFAAQLEALSGQEGVALLESFDQAPAASTGSN